MTEEAYHLIRSSINNLKIKCALYELQRAIERCLDKIEAVKYDPNQPRVPAGRPDGGQWTRIGAPSIDEIDDPPLEPVYPIETLIFGLAGLSARGAMAAARLAAGLSNRWASNRRIARAARAIEDYLGGRPKKVFRNRSDDLIIMHDDKKIRFDLNNTSGDKPHFHIEAKPNRRGKWPNRGNDHRYYFKD